MLPHAAVKGLEELNHYELNGKAIRVMPSQRDPSNRKSGVANVFIKVCEDTEAVRLKRAAFSPYLLCDRNTCTAQFNEMSLMLLELQFSDAFSSLLVLGIALLALTDLGLPDCRICHQR